jgi:hypothetical protein
VCVLTIYPNLISGHIQDNTYIRHNQFHNLGDSKDKSIHNIPIFRLHIQHQLKNVLLVSAFQVLSLFRLVLLHFFLYLTFLLYSCTIPAFRRSLCVLPRYNTGITQGSHRLNQNDTTLFFHLAKPCH